jgi:Mrp family chromosome partitioning ATPase/capsular polysaccharide biosynthesis protein
VLQDLQFIWVRKWLVIVIVILFTGGAFFYANRQTRLYEATARIMYEQPTNISNVLSNLSTDATSLSLQLQSAVNTVNSATVSGKARELMSGDNKGYSVSASVEQPDATAGESVANVVDVSAVSSTPAVASAAANAYAKAIIDVRKVQQQAQLLQAQDAIESQMAQFDSPASKESTDYLILSQRLRDLKVAEATVTGDFTVIQPASVPSQPFTPKPLRSAAFGFGVGLLLGVGVAYGVSQLDTRIRSHREVGEILDLPVVARIPRVSSDVLRSGSLVSLSAPGGQVAESLRVLRSNLDWMRLDGELKSILITSSEKGEGKTLTICNLAVTLALAGKQVVLVDADLRDPRVHASFGIPNGSGLSTVVHGSMDLAAALQPFDLAKYSGAGVVTTRRSATGGAATGDSETQNGSLQILTSGPRPPNPGEVIASQRMASVLQRLTKSKADYVLVDSPPILAIGDAGALAATVEGLLFVTNIEMVRRPVLEDANEALAALPCRKLGVIVVGERMESFRYHGYGYA